MVLHRHRHREWRPRLHTQTLPARPWPQPQKMPPSQGAVEVRSRHPPSPSALPLPSARPILLRHRATQGRENAWLSSTAIPVQDAFVISTPPLLFDACPMPGFSRPGESTLIESKTACINVGSATGFSPFVYFSMPTTSFSLASPCLCYPFSFGPPTHSSSSPSLPPPLPRPSLRNPPAT